MKNALSLLLLFVLLAGCGGPGGTRQAPAVARSRDSMMRKPMTTEQKIAAIERSSAPEDKKKAAIAQLRAQKR